MGDPTMRERIARAIATSLDLVWKEGAPDGHALAFKVTDAILAEMREPTSDMIDAGADADEFESVSVVYRAMIDAALEGK